MSKLLATVNKKEFLKLAASLPSGSGVSVTAANGVLLLTCFEHGVSYKLPAYVVRDGQSFVEAAEWNGIVGDVRSADVTIVDITVKKS